MSAHIKVKVEHGQLTRETLEEIRAELAELHSVSRRLKEFEIVVDFRDVKEVTAELIARDSEDDEPFELVAKESANNVMDAVVRSVEKIRGQLRRQQTASKSRAARSVWFAVTKQNLKYAVGIGIGVAVLAVIVGKVFTLNHRPLVDPRLKKPCYSVIGELFYNGAPANGAIVVLRPAVEAVAKEIWPLGYPHGTVHDDGSFRIGTYDSGDGAPVGEYKVLVLWPNPPLPTHKTESEPTIRGDMTVPTKRPKDPDKSPLAIEWKKGRQLPIANFTVEAKKNMIPRLELKDQVVQGNDNGSSNG